MGTGINTSALNTRLGTGTLKNNIGNLGAYQQIMQAFVNYITSVGTPPPLAANDNVPADVTNAANKALEKMNSDFRAAQNTASGMIAQINGITDVINAASTYTRHSEITIGNILDALVAYKNGGTLDRAALTQQLQRMVQNATRLEGQVLAGQNNTDTAVQSLQKSEAQLNTDFQALQAAIPPADGKALNLGTLTEQQAAQQLASQVDALNSDINSLQNEINWLTFGEVSAGVVGGLIAVVNFWNPMGWVAAGLTAYGEVEMVGKKAQDIAQKNTDLQKLALTQDEQAILHPLYTIKNAVSQLSAGVTAAEAISKELLSMKNDFQAAVDDIGSFIDHVTADAGADDLQSDAEYVKSDYDALLKLCDALLTPVPTQVVSQAQMTRVVDARTA